MARQIGDIKIRGTIGDVTFYRMDGEYYARMKSSLTAKKVKTHPHFALTRMYAKWLGEASKLASEVYRTLPKDERKYAVFCRLKTVAHKLVKEGVVREEVLAELGKLVQEIKADAKPVEVINPVAPKKTLRPDGVPVKRPVTVKGIRIHPEPVKAFRLLNRRSGRRVEAPVDG
jgi:hypothetical protein